MGTERERSFYKLGAGQLEMAMHTFNQMIMEQGGDPYAIFEGFLGQTCEAVDFLRASVKGMLRGESVVAFEKALVAVGVDPHVVFEGLRADPEFANFLAQVIATQMKHNAGPVVPVPAPKLLTASEAKQIMGDNIFDAADWTRDYGVSFTKRQLREAAKFPWSADFLNGPCPFNPGKLVRDTHFAFLGVTKIKADPLTVKKWMALHHSPSQPHFYFENDPWHDGQPYIDEGKEARLEPRWYLLLKEIVPNSTNSLPEEQIAMLGAGYELPSTIAEVTKDILVFRKTGVYPNQVVYAACRERTVKTDKVSAGFVSCVGYFDDDGLLVRNWHGARHNGVGVGASRKF